MKQEKSGITGSGQRKNERDTCVPIQTHKNPNSHISRALIPGRVGVYILNDSKAERHLTQSNKKHWIKIKRKSLT